MIPNKNPLTALPRTQTFLSALRLVAIAGFAVVILAAPRVFAATGIYRPINYQGKLSSTGGIAIANGTYNMRFRIYSAASAGVPLWTETWDNTTQRVTSTGGLFSIALGTYVTMTGSVNFNTDNLYLQVEFDPGNDGVYEEIFSPRRRFASVPYAHNANTLDGLDSTQFIRSDTDATASGTLTVSPRNTNKVGIDILSTSGIAATAALKISTQGANHILFGSGAANYDTNLYRSAVSRLKTDSSFWVVGTLSGSNIHAEKTLTSSGTLIVSGSGVFKSNGATVRPLVIMGASSQTADLTQWQTSAGTAVAGVTSAGQVLGSSLAIGTFANLALSPRQAGLVEINSNRMRITGVAGGGGVAGIELWARSDDTRAAAIIGSVYSASPAAGMMVQSVADSVAISTMIVRGGASQTGRLQDWQTSAGVNLVSILMNGTFSGSIVKATTTLASSGSLVWEGAASGATLYVATSINGAGLTDCDATTQVLKWDATTGRFSCGTATNNGFGTGNVLTIGDARYLRRSGGTMTGQLVVDITGGNINTIGLKVLNTISGAIIHAEKTLTASGMLITESGAMIDAGTLFVDAGNNRVGIGTTSPSAALDVAGAISSFTTNGLDGVRLGINAAGSGTPTILLDNGANTFAIDNAQGIGLRFVYNGASVPVVIDTSGNFGIGTNTPRAKLEVAGSISGATLFAQTFSGAGLVDCDASTSKLLWDTTTEKFSCGTATSNSFGTGNVLTIGDARYLKRSGGTMTGQLIVDITGGDVNTIGLKVLNTLSGASIHAEKRITSSGTILSVGGITTRGALSGASLTVNGISTFYTSTPGTLSYYYFAGIATDGRQGFYHSSGQVFANRAGTDGTVFGPSTTVTGPGGNTGNMSLSTTASVIGKMMVGATDITNNSHQGLLVLATAETAPTNIGSNFGATGIVDIATVDATPGGTTPRARIRVTGTSLIFRTDATGGANNPGTTVLLMTGTTLRLYGTLSGNILHAEKDLTSSGTLTIVGTGRFKNNLFVNGTLSGNIIHAEKSLTSSGLIIANGNITSRGTMSGKDLYISGTGGSTSPLLATNATNRRVGIGVIPSGTESSSNAKVVIRASGAGFQQLQLIDSTSATALNLSATATATSIGGTNSTSLGISTVGNTSVLIQPSGNTVATFNNGGGGALILQSYADSTTLQVKKLANQLSNLQTWTDNSSVVLSAMNVTGSLALGTKYTGSRLAVSGAVIINATGNPTNSFQADAGVALEVVGTISGTTLKIAGTGNSTFSGSVIIESGLSGSTIEGFNLASCSGSSQKLLYNNSTKKFVCGTDLSSGTFGTGNVITIGDNRYLRTSGGTMTGQLVVNITSGDINTIGLKVINAFSGANIHAERLLTSSGRLIVTGSGVFKSSSATTRPLVVMGASSQTANLQEWQNSAGTALSYISSAGKLNLPAGSAAAPSLNFNGDVDSGFYTIADGTLSFSSNGTTKWLAAANTGLSPATQAIRLDDTMGIGWSTDPDGVADEFIMYRSAAGELTLAGGGSPSTKVAFIIKSVAAQSVNIQEWRNSASAVLATISKSGSGSFPGLFVGTGSVGGSSFALKLLGSMTGNIIHAEKSLTSSGTLTVVGNSNVRGTMSGKQLTITGTGANAAPLISTGNGRIGLGTSSPNSFLDVRGTIENGLVSWWPMDVLAGSGVTMTDQSVTSATGTLRNGPTLVPGRFGKSMSFDGTNDYLDLGVVPALNGARTFTISTYFKRAAIAAVVGGGNYTDNNNRTTFDVFSDGNIYLGVANAGNSYGSFTASTDTKWHHLVMVFDGTQSNNVGRLKGYFDGVEQVLDFAGTTIPATTATVATSFKVGFENPRYTNGQIDDFRIYNRALSKREVADLYRFNPYGDAGTMSGVLILDGNATALLNVRGAISGASLKITGTGNSTFSGSVIIESGLSGSTIEGFNLASCSSSAQKLLYNNSTKKFVCGTDLSSGTFGTGNVITIGDARYLRTAGGTMTGQLVINLTTGFYGLKLVNTMSGNIIHAEKSLTSSGTLTVVGNSNFRGSMSGRSLYISGTGGSTAPLLYTNISNGRVGVGTTTPSSIFTISNDTNDFTNTGGANSHIVLNNTTGGQTAISAVYNGTLKGKLRFDSDGNVNVVATTGYHAFYTGGDSGVGSAKMTIVNGGSIGAGTTTPRAKLEVAGSISGATLFAQTFSGAGLTDCDAAASKLLWDTTTEKFSCGSDLTSGTFGTGNVLTIGDARYLKRSGGTMTGQLVVNITGGDFNTIGLKVLNTLSGAQIHAEKLLTSSGVLIVNGTSLLKGAVTSNSTIQGTALITDGTLIWASASAQMLSAAGNELSVAPDEVFTTLALFAGGFERAKLTAFGLGVGTSAPKTKLDVVGTISGSRLSISANANISGSLLVRGNTGIGTVTPRAKLEVAGSISGATLFAQTFSGAGLTDCDAAASKLLWDTTTEKFSCGSDLTSGTFGTGNVLTIGDARYLRTSGGTMTGQLVVNITNGDINTIGLKVINTLSGANIHAEKTLSTSGTLVIGGNAVLRDPAAAGNASTRTFTVSNATTAIVFQAPSASNNDWVTATTLQGTTAYYTRYTDLSNYININGAGSFEGMTARFSAATAARKALVLRGAASQAATLTEWQDSNSVILASISKSGTGSFKGLVVESGATMNSGLSIISRGTMSGYVIHAEKSLSSSGTLTVVGTGRFKGNITLLGTLSGNIIHAEKDLTSSGTILANGNIFTRGTLSGKTLTVMNGTSYLMGNVGISTTAPRAKLEVAGSISGATLFAQTFSGAGLTDCDAAASKLLWDTTTEKFSCGSDLTSGTFGTGNVLTIGDARYLRTSGGTMTGQLVVNITNGDINTVGLKVLNTLSGAQIHAEKSLTSSGTMLAVGNISTRGTLSGKTLTVMNGTSYLMGSVGIGTTSPAQALEVVGTIRTDSSLGSASYNTLSTNASNQFSISGNAGSILVLSTTDQVFSSWGNNVRLKGPSAGAGNTNRAGQSMTLASGEGTGNGAASDLIFQTSPTGPSGTSLNALVERMRIVGSGAVGIGTSTPGAKLSLSGSMLINANGNIGAAKVDAGVALEVVGTISGTTLQISGTGNSTFSGSVIIESLLSGSTIQGFNLGSCNGSTQKLLYNNSTKKFECGTDLNTGGSSTFGTGNVITIGDNRYLRTAGGTMTGQLVVNITGGDVNTVGLKVLNTLSGAQIHAEKLLTSSGQLIVTGSGLIKAGSANTKALVLRAAASQTANIQEWQSSAGAGLVAINSSGFLSFDGASAGIISGVNANGGVYFGRKDVTNKIVFAGYVNAYLLSMGNNGYIGFSSVASGGDFQVQDTSFYRNAAGVMEINNGTAGTFRDLKLRNLFASGGVIINRNGNLGSSTPDAGVALEVVGTISGTTLKISGTGNSTFSGSVIIENGLSGSTIEGFNLTSCNGSTQKLLYNNSTKKFECGTDLNTGTGTPFGTGNVLTIGDNRYLRTAGGTMTGQLVINLTSGFYGLKLVNTMSGNIIHAEKSLTSSGLIIANGNITSRGTMSGKELYISGTGGSTAPLLATNATNRRVGIGVIPSGTESSSNAKVVIRASGAGFQQLQLIDSTSATALNLMATATATSIGGTNSTSLGISTVGNTAIMIQPSGNTVATFNNGAGGALTLQSYADSTTLQVKKLANQLSNLQTWTDNNSVVLSAMNVTGSLALGTKYTGSKLAVSGAVIINATGNSTNSFQADAGVALEVVGTISGTTLKIAGTGNSTFSGSVIIESGLSGSTIEGFNLASCSGSSQKLLYNNSTKKFECGTDLNTGTGTPFGTGNVLTIGDARYLRRSGGTMTGQLVVNITGGDFNTIGLKVINAFSGAQIHAEKMLTSSGQLIVTGSGLLKSGSANTKALVLRGASSQTANIFEVQNSAGTALSSITSAGVFYIPNGSQSAPGISFADNTNTGLYKYTTNQVALVGGGGNTGLVTAGNNSLQMGVQWTGGSAVLNVIDAGAGVTDRAGTNLFIKSGGGSGAGGNGALAFYTPNILASGTTAQTLLERIRINSGTGAVGIGTSTPGARLSVSGAVLINAAGNIGASRVDAGVALEVVGTISGTTLQISGTGNSTFSGSVIIESLLSGSTIQGFNLGSCNGASQKLLYNNSTKKFECGTDLNTGGSSTFGTGNVLTIGDNRYLRTAGGTMTGQLVINLTTGFYGLKLVNTMSGNIIHAEKSLTSSGIIIANGNITSRGTMSGKDLYITGTGGSTAPLLVTNATNRRIGIGNIPSGNESSTNAKVVIKATGAGFQQLQLIDSTSATALNFMATATATSIGGTNSTSLGISTVGNTAIMIQPSGNTVATFNNGGGGALTLQSYADSTTLQVKKLANQLSNLQTWTDNSSVVLSAMNVTGSLALGTKYTGSRLAVSGAVIINAIGNANSSFAADPGVALEVVGTISGTTLKISGTGNSTFSGSVIIESLLSGSTIQGFNLVSCNGASQKLLYNNSTKKFECGTDLSSASTFGTGNVITIGDARYLRTAGGTMTGQLVINLTTGFYGLKLVNTMSGNIIHAEKTLTSSGTLVVVGNSNFRGSMSGRSLYVSGTGGSTTPLISTDLGNGRVGIGTSAPTEKLDVNGSIVVPLAGANSFAATNMIFGPRSGNGGGINYQNGAFTLYTGGTANMILGWGTINQWTSTAVLGWSAGAISGTNDTGLARNGAGVVEINNGTAGTLRDIKIRNAYFTALGSGNLLHAEKYLSSSGTILANGNITTRGTFSGAVLQIWGNGNSTFSGSVIIESLLSGSTIQGFNLRDCQGTSNKLTYSASTKKFLCETDQSTAGASSTFGTGNVLTIGDARYLRRSGGTMTGQLVVNITGGDFNTVGLKVLNAFSGANIHAEKYLTSSGRLIVTGSGMFKASSTTTRPLVILAAASQAVDLTQWQDSAGTNMVAIDKTGRITFATSFGGTIKDAVGGVYLGRKDVSDQIATAGYTDHYFLNVGSNGYIGFSAQATGGDIRGTDTAIYRNAAGVIEINQGGAAPASAGVRFGDLKLRNLFTSGSVVIKPNQTMGAVTPEGGVALEIIGTASGRTIRAQDVLASSGTLVVRGNSRLQGTLSGNILHAEKSLTSSGFVLSNGNITTRGTFSGAALQIWGTGNSTFSGSVIIESLLSGSTIQGFNLRDCQGTANKLTYSSSTKKFLCEADQTSAGGGLSYVQAESFFVNQGGDTMTGTLTINMKTGSLGLKIIQTASGNIIHAEKSLSSSGLLIIGRNQYFTGGLSHEIRVASGTDGGSLGIYAGNATYGTGGTLILQGGTGTGYVQIAASGPRAGSIFVNEGSVGTKEWTSVRNAIEDDGLEAKVVFSGGSQSNYLKATGFGFNIPADARITGIRMDVKRRAQVNKEVIDQSIRLVKSGAYTGDDKADFTQNWNGTGGNIPFTSYGGPNDLWGTTWTVSEINSQDFGVGVAASRGASGTHTGFIDAIRIVVFYEGHGIAGSVMFNTGTGAAGLIQIGNRFTPVIRLAENGGLVGIGTKDIDSALEVFGTISGSRLRVHGSSSYPGALITIETTGSGSTGSGNLSPAIGFNVANGPMDAAIYHRTPGVLSISGSLIVGNSLAVRVYGAATATTVCTTSSGVLAACSSSLRYKEDIADLALGLATVRSLRPVTFKWKNRDEHDLGFIAEEVNAVDPSLALYRDGIVDGVKYMQLTAVLTNALKALDFRTLGLTNNSGSLTVDLTNPTGSGMTIRSATHSGSTTLFKITSNVGGTGNTVLRVNASGAVFSDSTFNSQGADYAEWFKVRGQEGGEGQERQEGLSQGDLVCIDILSANTVRKCDRPADPNLMGIVSTNPAFIGNAIHGADTQSTLKNYVLVGLIGQVPAKVSLEAGPIRPGDALTAASIPGFARRAVAGESTVGVALEGFDGSTSLTTGGTQTNNRINVLISRRNQSLTVEAVEQHITESIAQMKLQDEIALMLQHSLQNLADSPDLLAVITTQIQSLDLSQAIDAAFLRHFSGSTLQTTQTLDSSTTRLLSDLAHIFTGSTLHPAALVTESATINSLTVSKLNLDNISFSGSHVQIGSLMQTGSLFVLGPITIQGLATFFSDVHIHGELVLSSKQAGFAVIPVTGTSVTIRFPSPMTGTPVVTATPDVPVLYGVNKVTATGFTIRIAGAATEKITFSYIALSADSPLTTQGTGSLASTLIPFPLNAQGQPFSLTDPVWTACVQGRQILDSTGNPYNCSRYHDGFVWEHPDLHIAFTYNPNAEPPLLVLPEGYEAVRMDDGSSSSSSSSISSSESSSSSSSVSSSESSSSSDSSSSSESSVSSSESSSSSSSDSSESSSSSDSSSSDSSSSSSEG